jgi:hypothetical protein
MFSFDVAMATLLTSTGTFQYDESRRSRPIIQILEIPFPPKKKATPKMSGTPDGDPSPASTAKTTAKPKANCVKDLIFDEGGDCDVLWNETWQRAKVVKIKDMSNGVSLFSE